MTPPTSFSITLTDLESVELRVKPTEDYHAHLLIEGDAINILKFTFEDFYKLESFKFNRAAKYIVLSQKNF
jgi:hypothetical protein